MQMISFGSNQKTGIRKNHEIFLSKLDLYGISGNSLKWFPLVFGERYTTMLNKAQNKLNTHYQMQIISKIG